MTNITLHIGGRDYTVACAQGEEAHVTKLGQLINGTLDTMPNGVAHSETRSLLFAALLLADELHELRLAASQAAPAPAAIELPASAASPAALDALASRLERLADLVDQAMPLNLPG